MKPTRQDKFTFDLWTVGGRADLTLGIALAGVINAVDRPTVIIGGSLADSLPG